MARIGKYEIVETLERGADTLVVRATHPRLARAVILRVALPAATEAMRAALAFEANLLDTIDHPNVVRVIDLFEDDGRTVVVLKDADGPNLARVLEATPRLVLGSAIEIGKSLALALEAVHAKDAVHADVKPKNVVLGKDGSVVLVDFGNAVPFERSKRRKDHGGSAPYLAPEQLVGEVSFSSDVFSLGVCLYEMLAGRRPFDREAERTRGPSPIPPLGKVRPEVPPWLEAIVHRCLERMPQDRPTAKEIAAVLQAHGSVAIDPRAIRHALFAARIVDEPESAPQALQVLPEERRRRWQLTAGLALVSALMLVAFYGLRPQRAKDEGAFGALRVLVSPWAEVAIDGRHIDTTPIGNPIDLPVGTHYVLFRHPSAEPVRREIIVRAGETELLEIEMAVPPRKNVMDARTAESPVAEDKGEKAQ